MNRREFTLVALAATAAAQWPLTAVRTGDLKPEDDDSRPTRAAAGTRPVATLAAAMQAAKAVQSVQFDNKGGAAGTIGLAQFVNASKGDPNAMLIGGMVMVGGIVLNKSPVDLNMVTPLARLTSEYEVVVVPANSPYKTMGDLVKAFKADPGKVSWNGGSAGGTDHILAGLIARAVGAGSDEGQLHRLEGRRRPDRQHRRRPRDGRRRRTRRVRRAHQERPHARAGGLRPGGDRRHPVAEGAGRRCRARQLARRLRGARASRPRSATR